MQLKINSISFNLHKSKSKYSVGQLKLRASHVLKIGHIFYLSATHWSSCVWQAACEAAKVKDNVKFYNDVRKDIALGCFWCCSRLNPAQVARQKIKDVGRQVHWLGSSLKLVWVLLTLAENEPKLGQDPPSLSKSRSHIRAWDGSQWVHSGPEQKPSVPTFSHISLTDAVCALISFSCCRSYLSIWETCVGAEGQKAKAVWQHVFTGVCMCVYRRPQSQEGAAALLIRTHFVLHWVTDRLEMYIPCFLRKVAAGRTRVGLA